MIPRECPMYTMTSQHLIVICKYSMPVFDTRLTALQRQTHAPWLDLELEMVTDVPSEYKCPTPTCNFR